MDSFSHAINFDGYPKSGKFKKLYWRIREAIDRWLCDHNIYWFWRLRDAYYYIYHRILQSHMIDTKVSKGHWCDKTELIKAGLLELVDEFVSKDGEDAFAVVDWEHDETHYDIKSRIIEVLYFKNVKLPEMENQLDKMTHEHFQKYPVNFGEIDEITGCGKVIFAGKDDPNCEKEMKEIWDLERKIEEEKQRILHMIIDLRPWLWT